MSNEGTADGTAFHRWLKELSHRLASGPENIAQLVQMLRDANKHHLLDSRELSMIEGVLQVAELRVRDIMIPRAHMVVIDRNDKIDDFLPLVIKSAHSRFPVIDDDRGKVVGILLAKDLLAFTGKKKRKRFDMQEVLRPAVFVPESKRLNAMLNDFRTSRNHMAIVVDEYGAAAGLVTIEDVLEQIVGEIEDEYDFNEEAPIFKCGEREYTAKAHTTIEEFNNYFGTKFQDDGFDTLSGLVTSVLGHVPQRGETAKIGKFRFKVLSADSRRIHLVNIRVKKEDSVDVD